MQDSRQKETQALSYSICDEISRSVDFIDAPFVAQ